MAKEFDYFEWTAELCKALGEDPKKVRSITIRLGFDERAIATIEKYVYKEDGNGGFLEVIKKVAWQEEKEECSCENCEAE